MIQGLFNSGLASRIDSKHWQGGFPESTEWPLLKEKGFGAVILCAAELQPEDKLDVFPDVDTILAPMDDALLTDVEATRAHVAARRALPYFLAGKRVLVTCAQGRNRSGLVSALILMMRHGLTGERAVEEVKMRRQNALTNASFVTYLRRLRSVT